MATVPNLMVQAVNLRLAEHGLENNVDARRMAVGLAADVKRIIDRALLSDPEETSVRTTEPSSDYR